MENRHPLHILVHSAELWGRLTADSCTISPNLCAATLSDHHKHVSLQAPSLIVAATFEERMSNEKPFTFTGEFSNHYNISQKQDIWLQPVTLVEIDTLTLRTPAPLQHLIQQYVADSLQRGSFLARQGDTLLFPLFPTHSIGFQALQDVRVTFTFPVAQGLVTTSTRIEYATFELAVPKPIGPLSHEIPLQPIVLSSFLQSSAACLQDLPSVELNFSCVVDMHPVIPRALTAQSDSLMRAVYLPVDTMISLSIEDGTWVELATTATPTHSQLGWAFCCAPSCTDASISPFLWFHLRSNPTSKQETLRVRPYAEQHESGLQFTPPNARAIHVALVAGAAHAGNEQALKDFFASPKLLAVNNIFGVRSEMGDPEVAYCAYYVVTRVETDSDGGKLGSIVRRESCSLFLQGQRNCAVPARAFSPPAPLVSHQDVYTRALSLIETLLDPAMPLTRCLLVRGARHSGKCTLLSNIAADIGAHIVTLNCWELLGESVSKIDVRLRDAARRAQASRPCLLLLRNVDVLSPSQDADRHGAGRVVACLQDVLRLFGGTDGESSLGHAVVLAATTSMAIDSSSEILDCFVHEVELTSPGEKEREDFLAFLMRSMRIPPSIGLSEIAKKISGFGFQEVQALVTQIQRTATSRVLKCIGQTSRGCVSPITERDLCLAGVCVSAEDFTSALQHLHASQRDVFGTPRIPAVAWADIGGLASAKDDILDTIQLPLDHPELISRGLRRSGVLLYGPPGVGKTLLAKAVATQCSLNFLSVKGPELLNMYVGQSEANVRDLFARARAARPCVVFFDELDALAPHRGRAGDSGGVMDRVVAQLLAELDGMARAADVFIIAATNRPDLVDPALLRPGRLDKLIYLGISSSKEEQRHILRALLRKCALSPTFDEEAVLARCAMNMTGADFYALCTDATLHAIRRAITASEQAAISSSTDTQPSISARAKGNATTSADTEDGATQPTTRAHLSDTVCLETSDFLAALATLSPSVSFSDLEHYESLRQRIANTSASSS